MKRYLLTIPADHSESWERFKEKYKDEEIGSNLDEALLTLIKRFNEVEQ